MKRIGLAISDPFRSFATPLEKIERTKNLDIDLDNLLKILKDRGPIELFIIGLPLHMDGKESQMSLSARKFGERLEAKTSIKCEFIDERLTSRAAESLLMELSMSRKDRSGAVDVVSASLILQTYLDLKSCI